MQLQRGRRREEEGSHGGEELYSHRSEIVLRFGGVWRSGGLDPMTTNLVVADESRTSKTICLAVSPSLKAWGIPGRRARLFEVIRKVAGGEPQAPGAGRLGIAFQAPPGAMRS